MSTRFLFFGYLHDLRYVGLLDKDCWVYNCISRTRYTPAPRYIFFGISDLFPINLPCLTEASPLKQKQSKFDEFRIKTGLRHGASSGAYGGALLAEPPSQPGRVDVCGFAAAKVLVGYKFLAAPTGRIPSPGQNYQ